jgi:hypothetical protein
MRKIRCRSGMMTIAASEVPPPQIARRCRGNYAMLAESHEQLDLLRRSEISNRNGIDKNTDRTRGSHKTAVALDDQTPEFDV